MADNNNNDKKKLDDNALADVAGGVKYSENGVCCENCGGTSFKKLSPPLVQCTECGYVQSRMIINPKDFFNN